MATHLTDAPIDPQALVRSVMRRSDGACVVFEGVVRDHHQGRAVEAIDYDAYRPMAEKELARIVQEVEAQFQGTAVAVRHRLGQLVVGDASIVIVAVSPHRAEAFDACRTVIERVKEKVPIWKKERGPDGEEWVGWQGRA